MISATHTQIIWYLDVNNFRAFLSISNTIQCSIIVKDAIFKYWIISMVTDGFYSLSYMTGWNIINHSITLNIYFTYIAYFLFLLCSLTRLRDFPSCFQELCFSAVWPKSRHDVWVIHVWRWYLFDSIAVLGVFWSCC